MRHDDELVDDLGFAWEEDDDEAPDAQPSRHARRRQRERRRRAGRSWVALAVAAVLLGTLGLGAYWGLGALQQFQNVREFLAADYSESDMGDEVTFTVAEGAIGGEIAANLVEQEIIKSRAAFVQLCDKDDRCQGIQPGSYLLRKHSPARLVVEILVDPANVNSSATAKFTVREGLTVIQTLQRLAEQTGLPLADFQEAAKDPAALGIAADWYVRGDGKQAMTSSIEGFLFPDTYFYDPKATAADILKMMVRQFLHVADEIGLKDKAKALGISPYEVLVTASLAQVEAANGNDFAKVARVVYNRAYKNLVACSCLQFDSTVNYWLEQQGKPTKHSGAMTASELNNTKNPWNTGRDSKGLPPSPISNPGKAALLGAAAPAVGDWIYFVAVDNNGTTKFAATDQEHCANIAEAIRNGVGLAPC